MKNREIALSAERPTADIRHIAKCIARRDLRPLPGKLLFLFARTTFSSGLKGPVGRARPESMWYPARFKTLAFSRRWERPRATKQHACGAVRRPPNLYGMRTSA
jgi:hypothetical protein